MILQPSWIRGYASNNSRALQRRRSSVTEYVKSSEEVEGGSAQLSTTSRPRGVTKSLSHQENLKYIQEERSRPELYSQREIPLSAVSVARTLSCGGPYLDMECGRGREEASRGSH